MTDDNQKAPREFDDFDPEPKGGSSINMGMMPTVGAMKGALAECTIIPVNASYDDRSAFRENPAALTLVMAAFCFVELIVYLILAKIDDAIFKGNISMLVAFIAIFFPFFLFRFNFVTDLVRFGNKLFPGNADAGAGIIFAMMFVLATFIFYMDINGFGSEFILLTAPMVDICCIHAVVSSMKFAGKGDGLILSLIITVVAALLFMFLGIAIIGDLDYKFVLIGVVAVLVASISGILEALLGKAKAGEDDCITGAAYEFSRPIILGISTLVFLMMAMN